MRQIYSIGETVYDIIFKNEKPLEARPGGAMLNTAVSLGRLRLPVNFVGDFANDAVGDIIEKFIIKNNISTQYVTRYSDAKSRLALAFLDDCNNAAYSFYKIRKTGKAQINCPDIREDDIIIFGSFYGIKDEVRDDLLKIIKLANQQNAILIYDPNFRLAHLGILPDVLPFIMENIALSDIVKGSDEDFANIFSFSSAKQTYDFLKNKCNNQLIYTANKHGVWLQTNSISKHYNTHNITPLSSIGAGDTFNAGLVYGLIENNVTKGDIPSLCQEKWDSIIQTAIDFATQVCLSYDNYISLEYANSIREGSPKK